MHQHDLPTTKANTRPRRSLTLLGSLAACLLAFGSTGCTPASDFGVTIEGPGLMVGSPVGVDIRNSSGNIFVRADASLIEPVVRATLRSMNAMTDPRPATKDDGVLVVARGEDAAGRYTLRVEADTDPDVTGRVQVDLDVRVPSIEGLRIQNNGGWVRAWGVGGSAQIDNGAANGVEASFIELRTDRPLNGPVDLRTSNGHIYLTMGPNSQGRFDIEVAPGQRYKVDHRLGTMTNIVPETNAWAATFNDGTFPIRLRPATGDAFVRIYERPMAFTPFGVFTP
ncbi:MAG: hypothetical protein AAF138_09270 [Planctomycetota bacterium]